MSSVLWGGVVAAALALGASGDLARAQSGAESGAEFFDGKTVSYVVATEPGGGYDTNGRLVAKYMEKHLPGATFVVRNMPGAGHVIGANHIYASEPDGLTLGTFNTGLIYAQLMGEGGVKFDLGEMSWIGKFAADPRVLMVSAESGITNFEDLMGRKEPVRFAAAGVGSSSTVESTMLINAADLPIQLITGYDGNDGLLAMRRGEVAGILGSRSSFEQFVAEGHGVLIAQIGGTQTDVPQLRDLVGDNPEARRVIALVGSQADLSRLTAAPPGVPADRLEALRAAYRAAIEDPELQAEAAALKLPVAPLYGEATGAAVRAALDQSPEMVAFLKSAMTEE